MTKINTLFAALVLTLFSTVSGSADPPEIGTVIGINLGSLYAVGSDEIGHSYLFTINPSNGNLNMVGDTGHNNCRGLDFTPDGKLKAFCEERVDVAPANNSQRAVAAGVTLELDPNSGEPVWVVPTGISGAVQDIAIRKDGVIFSHELSKPSLVHKHLEEDDFQAMTLGPSGVETEYLGMAAWGLDTVKIAANTGVPMLYEVDSSSGAAAALGELNFPGDVVNSTSRFAEEMYEKVQVVSMDTVEHRVNIEVIGGLAVTRNGVVPFQEEDAEFIALLAIFDDKLTDSKFINPAENVTMALALIDADTNSVGYITDLNTEIIPIVGLSDQASTERNIEGGIFLEAIAVRQIEPRPIPTMSEWGVISTALFLGILALIALKRRSSLA